MSPKGRAGINHRDVANRIGVFGGSNAADYMEVEWGCPRRLCLEYRGEDYGLKKEVSGDMQRGIYGEDIAAQWFQDQSLPKVLLRRSHQTFYHKEYPWLMAHVDRMVPVRTVVEIKCPNRFTFARIKREGLPLSWILQGQHYCMVGGFRRVMYIIHCFDPWDQLTLEVNSDEEIQKQMLSKAVELHAKAENGPLPDVLPSDDKRCQKCVFRSKCHGSALVDGQTAGVEDKGIETDDSLGDPLRTYLDARKVAEEATEIAEAAKDQLIASLKDRPAVQCGSHRIFYRVIQSFRWDTRNLESDHPELAEKYKRMSTSQPLRITEISNGNGISKEST